MTALAALTLATWLYLLLLHGRFWSAGPSLAPTTPAASPAVCVIIPARNEAATIAAAAASLLAQTYAGPLRVIVIDDRSTDTTAAAARAIPDPRLTVLTGVPRPPSWSGKLWAVHQGIAHAADAAILLLTDADIIHDPHHLATLVAHMQRHGLDLVSEMVELRCTTPAERWLVPAFVFFFQLLYPFAAVNDPGRRTAAAAGGTMLLRATALARIGGIASIRGALIDDVTLARAIKSTGGGIWLGHATAARSLRPYPAAADIWAMIARTAFVQLRQSWLLLTACTAAMALVWLAPPALTLFAHGPARTLGALAWIGATASYLPTLHRCRLAPWRAPFLPLIAAFYMAATIGSAWNHARGHGVRWKDRAYTQPAAP